MKNYFFSVSQKPQTFFSALNLMVKTKTGRPEGKVPPLALRDLQWHGQTANVTAAKERGLCDWKMSYLIEKTTEDLKNNALNYTSK